MPIPRLIRSKFYGARWRTEVRPHILQRAAHCCEACGKPDRTTVETCTFPDGCATGGLRMVWRRHWTLPWRDETGRPVTAVPPGTHFRAREVTVVLTIAHLNHKPGDDRPENLRAFCQWCHLHYDRHHHRDTRAARKDRARPLLAASVGPASRSEGGCG